MVEPMKKASGLRYKDYIRETVCEYQRRGNFIRIYPAKNSDIYDQYFMSPRPYNKVLYKVLFTDEILRSTITASSRPEIKMKMDMPLSAYEQYKKQQQDKANVKKEEEQKTGKKTQQARPTSSGAPNTNTASSEVIEPSQASTHSITGVKESTTAGGTSTKSQTQSMQSTSIQQPSGTSTQERVLITGDDILIEYVERLMNEIKNVNDNDLKTTWKT